MTAMSDLIARLGRETALYSSSSQIRRAPAYREILHIGDAAVPELLASLRTKPTMGALLLLGDITGENPTDAPGDMPRTVAAWIAWGASHE